MYGEFYLIQFVKDDTLYYLGESNGTYYFTNNINYAVTYNTIPDLVNSYKKRLKEFYGIVEFSFLKAFENSSVGKISIKKQSKVKDIIKFYQM